MFRCFHRPGDPLRFGAKEDLDRAILFKAGHGMIEIKADDGGEPGRISGYASVFEKIDSYNEMVMPGAFKRSLKQWAKEKAPIPMLWQHYSDQPIGGWDQFEEDDKGLKLSGLIDLDVPAGVQAYSATKKRYVRGLSIGYYEIDADPWPWERPPEERADPRKLKELDLRETSVVTFPALREARVDAVKARLAMGMLPTERECELALQQAFPGSTRADRQVMMTRGINAWRLRDATHIDPAEADAMKALADAFKPIELPKI